MSFNSQKRLGNKENNTKYRSLTRKPRNHVRILIYRTWSIGSWSYWNKTRVLGRNVYQFYKILQLSALQFTSAIVSELYVLNGSCFLFYKLNYSCESYTLDLRWILIISNSFYSTGLPFDQNNSTCCTKSLLNKRKGAFNLRGSPLISSTSHSILVRAILVRANGHS